MEKKKISFFKKLKNKGFSQKEKEEVGG